MDEASEWSVSVLRHCCKKMDAFTAEFISVPLSFLVFPITMTSQLPAFSLEIFSHDQTQLAVLNVTNPSEQLTYSNIIGAIQVHRNYLLCRA